MPESQRSQNTNDDAQVEENSRKAQDAKKAEKTRKKKPKNQNF